VDYTNAFVQARLDENVYMELPKLYGQQGKVLKLKRSVYGLAQSPLNWFMTLREGLERQGFRSSDLDLCLFIRDDVICLVYVDDCLFFAKDDSYIDEAIKSLQNSQDFGDNGFILQEEQDVAGFLGILMKKTNDGIELLQTGLIDRIVEAIGLTDGNSRVTPAEMMPLGSDLDGEPFNESWNYASIVGMLLYVASNSRPDIAYAVHSAARFTHAPKHSHGVALKRIVRYLIGTRDRGMLIRPTEELALDCYVDADFAGLYKVEDSQDPICVKSRTGFVITLGGAPVVWVSKLQTEIALSTLESEYIALSYAMRTLLPMRLLIEELADVLKVD
jgi:hypothetical protein